MGVLPSVLMVYSGVFVEGETPSLTVDPCVLDARFFVVKFAAFGHGIAMDSLHGVFLLATSFALRLASSVALFSSGMLLDVRCRASLLRSLVFSFLSAVKLFR